MKKIFRNIAIIALSAFFSVQTFNVISSSNYHDLTMSEVESNAACESVGWWNNDGNCVKNETGAYFCKSDTWYEITDCIQ